MKRLYLTALIILVLILAGCSAEEQIEEETTTGGDTGVDESIFEDIPSHLIDPTVQDDFCGISTEAYCETDDDCKIGGCSGELCQGIAESGLATTCDYKLCFSATRYNKACGCVNSKCVWN
jgi:eight-cysteine-cluster-containing protein